MGCTTLGVLSIASVEFVTIEVALFLLRDTVDGTVRDCRGSDTACIVVQARRICRVIAARVAGVVCLQYISGSLAPVRNCYNLHSRRSSCS